MKHVAAIGEQRRSWWLTLFADKSALARDYAKTHARLARDVMTSDVISVKPDALSNEHFTRRTPSLDTGKVKRERRLGELATRLLFRPEKHGATFTHARDVDVPEPVRHENLTPCLRRAAGSRQRCSPDGSWWSAAKRRPAPSARWRPTRTKFSRPERRERRTYWAGCFKSASPGIPSSSATS
jgi:hypothetical protein